MMPTEQMTSQKIKACQPKICNTATSGESFNF